MKDYDRIAHAIEFLSLNATSQPTLADVAAYLHLSPFHFQRLFCRWAGVTPKRYLQVLTLARAKQLLAQSRPLLEVSDALGLSSGSRLYDHFVQLEAVTPGEFKRRGEGLRIAYAVHETPFGDAFIALTAKGVCKFSFLDAQDPSAHLTALRKSWPLAQVHENRVSTLVPLRAMFGAPIDRDVARPISLYVSGTNFQVNVWKALLQIAPASVASYSQVAAAVGRPNSARAVGLAVGANPLAFIIPCHRVIQQSGKLGGYYWGETRKQAIHAWEAARYEDAAPL